MNRVLLTVVASLMVASTGRCADAPPPAQAEAPAKAFGQPIAMDDKMDEAILESFRGHARALAAKLTPEHFKAVEEPEMLCWLELKRMQLSLTAYELSADVTHLRDFTAALANLRATLKRGPDGFLAWRGRPIKPSINPDRPDAEIDEIQCSFRAVGVISRFVEIVDRHATLEKEFGGERAALVDLMEQHLVKMWEARGYWADLGERGGVYRNHALIPVKGGISLPWEKLEIMVDGLLHLHRVTGNDEHLRKAIMIGTWMKRTLQLRDGRYAWYNWVPAGKWDIHPTNPGRWKSWIGRSPISAWHDAEVNLMVSLYHHDVVFDRTDIDRIVKTQMEVCWNGDEAKPVYLNVDGKPSDRPNQRYLAIALTPFNEKLASFFFTGAIQQERFDKRASDWTGGVQANDWLSTKYFVLPATRDGRLMYGDVGKRFLAKPENQAFMAKLKFEVKEPGFVISPTPVGLELLDLPEPKGGF